MRSKSRWIEIEELIYWNRLLSVTTSQLVLFHDISVLGGQKRATRRQGEPVGRRRLARLTEKPAGRSDKTTATALSAGSDTLWGRAATPTRRYGANNIGMRFPCLGCLHRLNPLMGTSNYNATLTNMKLAYWPLMGGLLHLVQRGGNWAGPPPAQAPPRSTKCNSPPSTASVPITVLLYNGPLLCGFNVPITWLIQRLALQTRWLSPAPHISTGISINHHRSVQRCKVHVARRIQPTSVCLNWTKCHQGF